MTDRSITGTVKSWEMVKETSKPGFFYRVVHLVEEEGSNKYGHRITGNDQTALVGLANDKGPGVKIFFMEKQNGQYWNYVDGSLTKLDDAPKDVVNTAYGAQPQTPTQAPQATKSSYDERQASINFHADLKACIEIYDRLLGKKYTDFIKAGEELSGAVRFIRKVREHHLGE